ncbi:MAG: hypothetical protein H0W03_09530 [Solirubrobacterales bacterium]|nr:hypothetical protein [Solirubrobacterales bacterium]
MDDPTIRPIDDPTTPLDPTERPMDAPGPDEGTATMPSDGDQGGTDEEPGESPAFEPLAVGDENIAEGRVGGLLGGANQQQGQGQGG